MEGVQKTGPLCFVRLITLSNINIGLLSNLFHCQNRAKICNNTITPPHLKCVANVSVLKATVENKTTSVTTHFKSASSSSKAGTLNI